MQQNPTFLERASVGFFLLYGISGAGKSVVTKKIAANCEKEGRNIKFFYLASGDMFREAAETIYDPKAQERGVDPNLLEVGKIMAAGKYVPTLEAVTPSLEKIFKEYFTCILKGEKAVLVLDGFLRIGESEDKRFGREGKIIAPQIDQVGEAAIRGLRDALKSDYSLVLKLADQDPELLVQVMSSEEVDYAELVKERLIGSFVNEMVLNANHTVIQIPPEDGETLMRFRFFDSIKNIKKQLDVLDDESGEIRDITNLLDEALVTLSGKKSADEAFDHKKTMDEETGKLADKTLTDIANKIMEFKGLSLRTALIKKEDKEEIITEKLTLRSAILAFFRSRGIDISLKEMRDDDQTWVSRKNRTKSYDGVKKDVLEEFDVYHEGYKVVREGLPDNVDVIENGPSLDIGYDQLNENSEQAMDRRVERLINVSREFEALEMARAQKGAER